MSWQAYIDDLMIDGICDDCAIVGYVDAKSVWGACSNGTLKNMTIPETDVLTGLDREDFFIHGPTVGGVKCSVIRDELFNKDVNTMDLRTKAQEGRPSCNICVAKTNKTLVILMGKDGIHGGTLNKKIEKMAKYLTDSGY